MATPTEFRGAAALIAAVGAVIVVSLSVMAVERSASEVAVAEARMASGLWEAGGGRVAGMALLGERVRIVEVNEAAGIGTWAYRYGSMEPEAWIRVASPSYESPSAGAILFIVLFTLVAIAVILRPRGTSVLTGRVLPVTVTAVALLLTSVIAERWAHRELVALSGHHLHQGARAVELHLALDPGSAEESPRAARVAGLPWAPTTKLEEGEGSWTMPEDVAQALRDAMELARFSESALLSDSARLSGGEELAERFSTVARPRTASTLQVRSLSHHYIRAGPFTLVMLGHEESSPLASWIAIALLATVFAVGMLLGCASLASRGKLLRKTLVAWGFLTPSFGLLAVFTFGPILFSLWISLHDWHLLDAAHTFRGLTNYHELINDRSWWHSVINTIVFTAHVPVSMAFALALALLTQSSRRWMNIVRLALFLPSITSVAAIAVVWKWLLDDHYGLANQVLAAGGIEPVMWLTSPEVALFSLMVVATWMVVGYQVVVFRAGLSAIPASWYDAARVDGAGVWRRFIHITLPGLRHTLFFVFVTSVIGSFQVFGLVFVMTEGGPLDATDVAVYHIYREAWRFLQFGDAAAMSWVLFILIFGTTWLHFRLLDQRGRYAPA